MNKTRIEYLTDTWNPLAMRCTPISDGCRNCWHLSMARRLTANPLLPRGEQLAYAEDSDPEKGPPVLRQKELEAPLHLKKPARIGVQFMGDLFHESVSIPFLFDIFQIIERCPHHTFLILTKRPQRAENLIDQLFSNLDPWPFKNLWLGVSVEDQKTADERIPILLQIPAAHRWVSVEPMLGPVDLNSGPGGQLLGACDLCNGEDPKCPGCHGSDGLEWVVCGGETGPGARPVHPDWVRSLRDQCQAADVPFFFKGWGTPRFPNIDISEWVSAGYDPYGKKPGHLLDGREWRELPK